MKEKIIIDEKACSRKKKGESMTLVEVLFALAVKYGLNKDIIQNMLNREILVKDPVDEEYLITQRWSGVVEEILCDSNQALNDDRLINLAKKIQDIFPPGFKTDEKTNQRYVHKSNSKAIMQALKRFITYYDDYSDEDILEATRQYVASFRGNYSRIEMANYFVFKDNTRKGGDITSSLATFLENPCDVEISEGPVIEQNTSTWLSDSRN